MGDAVADGIGAAFRFFGDVAKRLFGTSEQAPSRAAPFVRKVPDAMQAAMQGAPKRTRTNVVGVTYANADGTSRQINIKRLGQLLNGRGDAALVARREPSNPYDVNAIAILDAGGRQLGYLPRAIAARLARAVDAGRTLTVSAEQVTGGAPGMSYGLIVWVIFLTRKEVS